MNWVVPGKLIAFKGPRTTPKNQVSFTPGTLSFFLLFAFITVILILCFMLIEFYVPFMKKLGVTAVVRLNKEHYDKTIFVQNEINHYGILNNYIILCYVISLYIMLLINTILQTSTLGMELRRKSRLWRNSFQWSKMRKVRNLN